MVAVNSTMPALGSSASNFKLANFASGAKFVALEDFNGQPVLLMFICNHCPFVIHVAQKMAALGNQATEQGFGVVAINANDINAYPEDGPQFMTQFAEQLDMQFPYCFDETQEVAKAYGAACTPDFFVYDANHRLQYRGQMDSSRPNNQQPVTGEDLESALEAVRAGRIPNERQTPSIGCNIKWQSGNEPDYF